MASRDGRSTYWTISARSTNALSVTPWVFESISEDRRTDGLDEIASGHDQDIFTVLKLVKLRQERVYNPEPVRRLCSCHRTGSGSCQRFNFIYADSALRTRRKEGVLDTY
jgi:hypothetical protein